MHVREILKRKGEKVVKVRPEDTVATASRLMTEMNIGALIVADVRGKVVGIISERDVVHGLARAVEVPRFRDLPVSELMTQNVVSCGPDDEIADVMATITRRHIRHIPVMVGDDLKGIISIADVVRHRLDQAQMEMNVLHDVLRSGRPRGA